MSEQSEILEAEPAPEIDETAPEVDDSDAGEPGRPNPRKVREGLVVSTKMDKTAVVAVIERVRHPRYVKTVQRTKRLYAHDPEHQVKVGDRVRLAETRPMSKLKRWRIVEVLERAK
jgi:small subunit ribosomal protein S17